MLTVAQAARWVEQHDTAVMARRDWELGLAAWWELASLPIDFPGYQHLLFEETPQEVGFVRQFFDDDVFVVGFSWRVRRPGSALPERPENIACTYGGLEGRSYEDKDILDFRAFRDHVTQRVAEYSTSGVELTGESLI